ncbi:MAG: AsmA-like C-terminal domain-containing protein [Desulfovermiculus sp.]
MPRFQIHKAQSTSNSKLFLRRAMSLLAMAICLAYSLGVLLWTGEYIFKHSPWLEQGLLAQAQNTLPYSFQAHSLELELFPWPSLVVHEAGVELPDIGPAKAAKIEITPSQSALLQGKLRLSKLIVSQPTLNLPVGPVLDEEEVFPIQDLSRILSRILPQGAKLRIRSGHITLASPKGQGVTLDHIFADLTHAQEYNLDLRATSERASEIRLSMQSPESLNHFKGRLRIQDLQPEYIFQLFEMPDFPLWLGAGRLNTKISFQAQGMTQASARVDLKSDGLMLCTRDNEQTLQGVKLQADLNMDRSSIRAAIHHFSLGHPEFSLAGQVVTDLTSPWLQLNLRGQDLTLPPLSQACLDLFPESKFLNQLFGIIRGGDLPYLSVSTHGSTASALKEELSIQGQMQNGIIHIPKLDLRLHDVNGTGGMKNKILSGSSLSAGMDQARAWDASFRYGLEDTRDRPFDLSLRASGPVEYIPPILRDTIKDQAFVSEVNGFAELEGQFKGGLDLHKTEQGMDFDIQAQKFEVQGEHRSLPWPVKTRGRNLHITNHGLELTSARNNLGPSRMDISQTALSWKNDPELSIQSMSGKLDLASFWPWLLNLPQTDLEPQKELSLDGLAHVQEASIHIPFSRPRETRIEFLAQAEDIQARHPVLPEPLALSSGEIRWGQEQSSVRDLNLRIGRGSASLSGEMAGSPLDWDASDLDLSFSGQFDAEATRLAQQIANVPSSVSLKGPMHVRRAQLKEPIPGEFVFQTFIDFDPGMAGEVDLQWAADRFELRELKILDQNRKASISMLASGSEIQTEFSGDLKPSSLKRIFSAPFLAGGDEGSISGQFFTQWERSPLRLSNAKGELTLTGLELDSGPKAPPLSISKVELRTVPGKGLHVRSGDLIWEDKELTLGGYVQPQSDKPAILDLSIQAHRLDAAWIQSLADQLGFAGNDDPGNAPQLLEFQGQISAKIASFTHQERTFSPLHMTWVLDPGGPWTVHILEESALCGISLPGKVTVQPDQVYFGLAPSSQELDLSRSLQCLFQAKDIATGELNLRGNVQGTAPKPENLISNLNGELDLTVTDGRLLRFTVLSKLIELLNTTEILFGTLPDLEHEGIRFSRLHSTILFKDSRATITQGLVDGHSLEIGFHGDIDLHEKSLELTVLVAPLKTVDRLMKKIPLISGLTGGNLVTIPVRISGDWDNPKVTPLSPQAVSKELVGLMRRTLKLPLKILNPFMRHENEEK